MSQTNLQILAKDEGFVLARLSSLGILVWLETPTVSRTRVVAQRLGDISPRRFALLTVVTPACAPVGAEVRSIFDEGLRTQRSALLGTATVIQVEGVLGGLSRAISRAVALMVRAPYPNNVYATVADAATWLPQVLADSDHAPPSSEEILVHVSQLLERR